MDSIRELWVQIFKARRQAGVSQAMLARRLRMTQQNISHLETHGPEAYRLTTLQRLLDELTGWVDPRTGPASPPGAKEPLTPEQQARLDRRREQKRQAQHRWRERHPDQANEYAARYRNSPRGKEYQRTYGRMRRAHQRALVEQGQQGDDDRAKTRGEDTNLS